VSQLALPGFDFTLHARRLCEDMVARLQELRHVDLSRIGIGFCQTRRQSRFGMHASLTPLRFPGGQTCRFRRGRQWRIQRVELDGREMLYLLNFYLPRFLDLPFAEKLTTVVHELWHISPRFDGDLRRFGGRCYAHSGSQRRFDAHAEGLARRWLANGPPAAVYAFLRPDFRGLESQYGRIFGRRIPAPKLVPIEGAGTMQGT
jgi:hypothetical protein